MMVARHQWKSDGEPVASILAHFSCCLHCILFLFFSLYTRKGGNDSLSVKNGSNFEPRPLLVLIQDDKQMSVATLSLQEKPLPLVTDRRNHYWLNHFKEDSDASYDNERRPWPKENCEALGEWMTGDACNCNSFHEIEMTQFYDEHDYQVFRYINDGGFRTAWMIAEYDGTLRVLKTLKYIDKATF